MAIKYDDERETSAPQFNRTLSRCSSTNKRVMGESKQVLEICRFSHLSSKYIIRVISTKIVDLKSQSYFHFGREMSAPHFNRTIFNRGSKNERVRGKSKQLLQISRFRNFSSNHILRAISSKTSKL